jgi:hypothetical protein
VLDDLNPVNERSGKARKSGAGKSGTGKSGTGKSGTGKSGTGKSGTGKSGTGKSGAGNSNTGNSSTGESGKSVVRKRRRPRSRRVLHEIEVGNLNWIEWTLCGNALTMSFFPLVGVLVIRIAEC